MNVIHTLNTRQRSEFQTANIALLRRSFLLFFIMKRKASSILARPSPYHVSVTLYEAAEETTTVRRSKRIKSEPGPSTAPLESDATTEATIGTEATPKKALRTKSLKVLKVDEELASSSTPEPPKRKRSTASPRKPKPIPTALETPHPAPARWQETYNTIKRMRAQIVAPVDTMGCDQAQLKETDPKVPRSHVTWDVSMLTCNIICRISGSRPSCR